MRPLLMYCVTVRNFASVVQHCCANAAGPADGAGVYAFRGAAAPVRVTVRRIAQQMGMQNHSESFSKRNDRLAVKRKCRR